MQGSTILDAIGNTPLVRLTRLGKELPMELWVKCEHLNPGGSIKDRIAKFIVDDAERRGSLQENGLLVEATAGNTGVGLAIAAAQRGYRLLCVMPEKMSEDKRRALRILGAEVVITPNRPPGHPENFQSVARRLAEERGGLLTDQFNNPANVRAHYETTGPEIERDCEGDVAALVAGSGTGGTLSGAGRYLKERIAGIKIVLADPVGSRLAHKVATGELGPDGAYAVEGIGSSEVPTNLHLDVIDEAISIDDDESFHVTRRLLREEGLLVGGSAGTAVAAALRLAASPERLRAGRIVAVLPDSWDRYLSREWLEEPAHA